LSTTPFTDQIGQDLNPVTRTTPTQTYNIYNRAVVDGVGVKTMRDFSARISPTALQGYTRDGLVSHEMAQNVFGQITDGKLQMSPFTDIPGKINPVNYISQPDAISYSVSGGTILSGGYSYSDIPVVDNRQDFTFRDGIIDVIGTRDSMVYVSIDGGQMPRGPSGACYTMEKGRGTPIVQIYQTAITGSTSNFYDEAGFSLREGSFFLQGPGIINDTGGKSQPFLEKSFSRTDDFYFLSSSTYLNQGFIPSGSVSAAAGFIYGNCPLGTDSIAFGGLKL
jgi:hypothetical protein